MIRRALTALERVIWPRGFQCLCCDERAEKGLLCNTCRTQLNVLRICDQAGDVRCIWPYAGCAKQLVTGLKFNCMEDCADVIADEMVQEAKGMMLPPDTIVTWVTMPDIRRRERGIDHGRVLCEAVACRLGLPSRQLLLRARRTHTQRGLDAQKRQQNVAGAFECLEKLSTSVLLIDDVFTTGATVRACAEVLQKSGASRVYVMTATRVGDYSDVVERG